MSTLEKQKANQNLYGVAPYQETKGEEYMGEPMRKHFTKILTGWKQELMVGVDKTVDHMKEEAANFADPADRATQEEEFALELRNRDRERKQHQRHSTTRSEARARSDDEERRCGQRRSGLDQRTERVRAPGLRHRPAVLSSPRAARRSRSAAASGGKRPGMVASVVAAAVCNCTVAIPSQRSMGPARRSTICMRP